MSLVTRTPWELAARLAVKWGIVLAAAVAVWTAGVHLLGFYTTNLQAGERADILATLLPVVVIALAVREHARRTVGVLWRVAYGLVTGTGAGLVSAPLTAGALWFYHHVVNPRWLEYVITYEQGKLAQTGASATVIADRVAALRAGGEDSAQIMGAFVGTTVLSLLIAGVVSVIVWMSRRRSEHTLEPADSIRSHRR